jgi:hypothetical protein
MIEIESITIKDFRGIRDLTLNLKRKSFAICGPNGTGKSGIVDALEFGLTGNVSRLSGEGRGEVSLKKHGPHVDKRDDPDKARVTLSIHIPHLNKTVTVERGLKDPRNPVVTPNDPAAVEVLRIVEKHPEIVLSRRELIRYVLATPGKRAEEVRALLHLDQVEQVRTALQRIANNCDKVVPPLTGAAAQSRDNLLRAVGIDQLSKEKLLGAANKQRAILGLTPLSDLTDTTSLKDGMASPKVATPQRIPKAQALADIKAARESLAELGSDSVRAQVEQLSADLIALVADSAVAQSATWDRFYTVGLNLITAEACPFCDTEWSAEDLKKHVEGKLSKLKAVTRKLKAAETKMAPLLAMVRKARADLNAVLAYSGLAKPPLKMPKCVEYCANALTLGEKLSSLLPLADAISLLPTIVIVPKTLAEELSAFETVVSALPEPNKQDAARDWLTVAQERLEVWREAMRKLKSARANAKTARDVYDVYSTTSDQVLSGLYTDVNKHFTALYGFVNRDDEEHFKAKLVPSLGKLGFDVDFYGRGYFPPGAYHSEGHQDTMGLCLYLALMKHLHGTSFSFAVLDDVLMSVDAGHRREVCALLKKEFPHTQFVITTHDPIWLRHMKTEGLIGDAAAVQFRGWSVDQGPHRWDNHDVWAEIENYLKNTDVRAAAALLRHYLEYTAAELCHHLRASVEYHGDAKYQLGELLPAATSRLKEVLKRARDAAVSWDQKELADAIGKRAADFARLVTASNVEQWQVNAAVHFNTWENLSPSDFGPVVKAFRELIAAFFCPECGACLRLSPEREKPESIRCACGTTNLNLKRK